MPAKKKKVTTTDSNQLNEGIFASLVNENKNITTFEDTDAALVKDWLPTLIPSVDSVLLGGFPLSGRVTEIFGQPSVGKSLALGESIPTPKGKIPLKDLKVGDTVFDMYGKPTKIKGYYPQGKLDVYEVTLTDGRTLKVSKDHIWGVYTSRGNLINKTTQELLDAGIYLDKRHPRFKIPSGGYRIDYPSKEIPVDPYTLGVLLGDGCLTFSQLTISSQDPYVINKVATNLSSTFGDLEVMHQETSSKYRWQYKVIGRAKNNCYLKTKEVLNGVINIPVKTKGKYIPECYMYNDYNVRLSLAQGLLDTDGHVAVSKGHSAHLSWVSVNEELADQFASLLRSLGYRVTKHAYAHKYKDSIEYTLRILSSIEELKKLVTLPRYLEKFEGVPEKHRDYSKISIKSIEPLGYKAEMACLYVDNKEHLFLANDYVVTHNTTITHSALAVAQKTGKVIPVIYDIEGTVNKERLRELGVDPSKVITLKPTKNSDGSYTQITVEQVFQHMIDLLASIKAKEDKEIDNGLRNPEDRVTVLFIWDTVAMTLPDIAAKAEVGAQQVGQQARALSDGIRRVNVNLLKNNGALIALNQARDDIGGNAFIKETKTVGGNGWQHELSLRLLMTGGSKEKVNATDKTNIGKTVRLHFKKSKVGNNDGAVAEAVLLKDTGFDIYYNAYLSAKDNKIIEQRGSWFRYVTENGESIQKHNADWTAFLKSDEGFPVFTEIWQRLVKLYFPQCYPPLFNSSVVLTEEAFPFIKGLREYYSKIQDKLPMEEQNTNYRVWKRERSETK